MSDIMQELNIWRIDRITHTRAVVSHYDGNDYEIGLLWEYNKKICGYTITIDDKDIEMLKSLPVPSVTLAPPSILTTIPYFKP